MTTENKVSESSKKAPSLEELASAPLKRAGQEVKAGTYPGLFCGFGEPYYQSKSFKGSKPVEKLYVRQYFLIRMPNGECERISDPVALGADPKVIHIKSTLYVRLRAFSNNDEKVIAKDGSFAEGINLKSFDHSPVIINIKVNEKDGKSFTNIESCAPASLPLNYPTKEEAEALQTAHKEADDGEDVPF